MYPGYPLFFSTLGGSLIVWPRHPLGQLVYLIFSTIVKGSQCWCYALELITGVTLIHSNQVLCSLRAALLFVGVRGTPNKGTRFPSMDEVEVYYDFAGGLRESILN